MLSREISAKQRKMAKTTGVSSRKYGKVKIER
ncbi:hypothetical protein V6Z11_A10G280700 [Gossypium hirsutum]